MAGRSAMTNASRPRLVFIFVWAGDEYAPLRYCGRQRLASKFNAKARSAARTSNEGFSL
jgi:hypothetical protein